MVEQTQLDTREIDKVADWARRGIWIIGSVLATFFAFLQLKDVPYQPLLADANPLYIREFLLALYYLGWVFGANFDVSIQRYVYAADPLHGNMPRQATLIVIVFLAAAAVLLSVRESDKLFALALGALIAINVIGYVFIQSRIKPMIEKSKQKYAADNNYFSIAQLKVVTNYMLGNWQWRRFAVLGLIIAAANYVAFSEPARLKLAEIVHTVTPSLSVETIAGLLPIALLALFIIVSEAWISYRRLSTWARVDALDDLRKDYRLETISASG